MAHKMRDLVNKIKSEGSSDQPLIGYLMEETTPSSTTITSHFLDGSASKPVVWNDPFQQSKLNLLAAFHAFNPTTGIVATESVNGHGKREALYQLFSNDSLHSLFDKLPSHKLASVHATQPSGPFTLTDWQGNGITPISTGPNTWDVEPVSGSAPIWYMDGTPAPVGPSFGPFQITDGNGNYVFGQGSFGFGAFKMAPGIGVATNFYLTYNSSGSIYWTQTPLTGQPSNQYAISGGVNTLVISSQTNPLRPEVEPYCRFNFNKVAQK